MSAHVRRNTLTLVGISVLSGFGSTSMSLVARMWIVDLTGSSSLAGLATLGAYLPTLAAPWLGALTDRAPRRRLLIGVNLGVAAVLASLLLVHSAAQVPVIFAVLLAYGVGYVLIDAGETALMPAVLPVAALGTVNGLRSSAQEGTKLLAPLVGAGLYAWRGGGAVAVLSGLLPLVVAALYATLRVAPAAPSPGARTRPGLRHAVATLWGDPAVRVPVLVAAVTIAASGFTTSAVLDTVVGRLALPSSFIGVLASAQGAGSIAGGLLVGRAVARYGPPGVAAGGTLLFATGCLLWSLPWWPAVLAGSAVVGAGLPGTLVAGVTAVQTRVPTAILGRAAATATTVMFGPIAVVTPIGAAAVHYGSRPALLVAAGCCVLAAAAVARSSRRHPTGPRPAG